MANYNKSFNFKNGLQVDNNHFVINANGLVGIGSTVPTQVLDVTGNINVSGFVTTTSLYVTTANIGVLTSTKFYGDGSSLSGILTSGTATSSTYAINAGIATYATTAGIATYAINAGIATYATTAGIATYATKAGIATYTPNAGIATYAPNAGIATYATTAGIATYTPNAGIATYAPNAGIATYAPNAGISTYAPNAGIATSVIGGIGSITQLLVTGVSSFTNGPVYVGTSTNIVYVGYSNTITGSATPLLGIGVTAIPYLFHVSSLGIGIGTWGLDYPSSIISIGLSAGPVSFESSIRIGSGAGGGIQNVGSNVPIKPNIMIGAGAGYGNTSDHSNNVIIGTASLDSNGRGLGSPNNNVVIGNYAASSSGGGVYYGGNYNVVVGNSAGNNLGYGGISGTGSNYNTIIGYRAGYNLGAGDKNIAIGYNSGVTFIGNSFSNNILIGNEINPPIQQGGGSLDTQLAIGIGNTYWITGNNSFNVGIGITLPQTKLHVQGDLTVSGSIINSNTIAFSIAMGM